MIGRLTTASTDGGVVDPVPGAILKYLMNGSDSLIPINSPTIVAGLDLPDLLATEFNGVDQYYNADADSATMATIGSGAFSIAFRIKISIASARSIIEFGDPDAIDGSGFKINTRGVGGITFKIANTNLNFGNPIFLGGKWAHVVLTGTGSGGTLRFYVNGVVDPVTRTLPTYNLIDTNDFQIADTGLPCILDGMWVFPFVTSQSQVDTLKDNAISEHPVPDFLANYKLDNNDANVVPINTPTLVAAPALPDKLGWLLNGTDQHGEVDADSALFAFGTGAYSITGWLNSSELTLRNLISTGAGATDGSLTIRTAANGKLQIRSFNQNRTSTAVVVDGTDTFFCISCDGSGLDVRIYINGVIDSTQTASPYNLTDQGVLVIGARGDNTSGRWTGMLDDLTPYNRAITDTEQLSIYNNV